MQRTAQTQMKTAELKKLLKAGEWNDVEFKEAFEFFIPGLDKEVDMASDLVKAMFSDKRAKGITAQVAGQVSPEVGRVLEVLQTEMVRLEIQKRLKLKGRANFEDRYLKPALQAGFIELTIPDKPRSRLQKYRLTDKGRLRLQKTKP